MKDNKDGGQEEREKRRGQLTYGYLHGLIGNLYWDDLLDQNSMIHLTGDLH